MSDIKCPYCENLDITPECINILYSMKTAGFIAPFYGSDGIQHHHDTNRYTENLQCSNGHCFTRVVPHTCWCGWKQEIESADTSITWDDSVPPNTTSKADTHAPKLDAMWEIIKDLSESDGVPFGSVGRCCIFCDAKQVALSNIRHKDTCIISKAYRMVWGKADE